MDYKELTDYGIAMGFLVRPDRLNPLTCHDLNLCIADYEMGIISHINLLERFRFHTLTGD